ncbi:BnaC04g52700D [Brassica napus]|uniref:BnaC04g52700D protein n=1 Tax=Brassica napus TaxID=3708 RepID=A0A078IP21_BRANA|nr:BnaC04g52700D [Brassica napus]
MLKQHRYLQDQQSQRGIKCKRGLKYTYWRSRSQKVFLALPCIELERSIDRSFAVVHFFGHHRIEMLTRGVFRFLVKLREDCYPAPENDMSTEI